VKIKAKENITMYVLGLSGGFGHDAAACLVNDGRLIAMVEEERLVRIKRAPAMAPVFSALYCLEEAQLSIEDIDLITLSWIPDHDPATRSARQVPQLFTEHEAFQGKKLPPIEFIDHHIAHAASAYYSSGFERAVILVVDGHGEGVSVTAAYGDGRTISVLRSYGVEQSLGHFYESVTRYIGLGRSAEGKFMGLAGYGQPVYDFPIIQLTDDGYRIDIKEGPASSTLERYFHTCQIWDEWLYATFGPPLVPSFHLDMTRGRGKRDLPFTTRHYDIAASAQQKLEQVILHVVKNLVQQTGCRNVVLSGGVCLNSSMNGALQHSGMIDGLYIFPASNDAGGSFGAALEGCRQAGHLSQATSIQSAAWGPAYDDADIYAALKSAGLTASQHDDISNVAASLLANGNVIGWFQGRLEVGPRALGQRSILSSPAQASFHSRVNKEIKYREIWRPFAPSILREQAERYLKDAVSSPFMLLTFDVSEEQKTNIPAVVHVDGTTRPQTVERSLLPEYWELIHAFEQKTGIPMVLNTSFNLDSEPIVCTPIDALRTFYSCGLDALVLGHFLISKPGIRV
jgi:carbamoyltransferase